MGGTRTSPLPPLCLNGDPTSLTAGVIGLTSPPSTRPRRVFVAYPVALTAPQQVRRSRAYFADTLLCTRTTFSTPAQARSAERSAKCTQS